MEPNDSLILPSAQHDGIPLGVEDWPVHPEDPVDSYEGLRDRLTEAVQNMFPGIQYMITETYENHRQMLNSERLDDYAEAYKRASEGVKGLAPILDSNGIPKSSNGPRPSVMSEIEDLLVEVSHHGLAKGAELTVGLYTHTPIKPPQVFNEHLDQQKAAWLVPL